METQHQMSETCFDLMNVVKMEANQSLNLSRKNGGDAGQPCSTSISDELTSFDSTYVYSVRQTKYTYEGR